MNWILIIISFFSGAIPWATLLGKVTKSPPLNTIGDGNPGAANLWKAKGWKIGLISVFLEIFKGFLPIYFILTFFELNLHDAEKILISLMPIFGHGFSPFLKFKGGKSLAVTWGAWIGLTNGLALPIGSIYLLTMHSIQKHHAWTVLISLIGMLITFTYIFAQTFMFITMTLNILFVIFKHKNEFSEKIILRNWIMKNLK